MDLHSYGELVRRRRTNLRIDRSREVDQALIIELCTLATWAPNHKLTQPWRFAVLTGGSRARLGEALARAQQQRGESDPERLEKARSKYLRAPVMLAVASAADPDPLRRRENRDAVAAGVQTLLMGATAAGLASYWGTGLVVEVPEVKALCGLGPDDEIVSVVYLGWPMGEVPTPARRTPVIHWAD